MKVAVIKGTHLQDMATNNHNSSWRMDYYNSVVDGDLETFWTTVTAHKVDINAPFQEASEKHHRSLCPVHLAAFYGHKEMLKFLHRKGALMTSTSVNIRRPAFHYAIGEGHLDCAKFLLSCGVDPNTKDIIGNSPAHYVAEEGSDECLLFLQKCGVDLNARGSTGKTPLMKAIRSNKLKTVLFLINQDVDVNIRDSYGDTALHFASRGVDLEICRAVLAAAPDVDAVNDCGVTPLMESVRYRVSDVTEILIQSGCDVNIQEKKSCDTALHMAVSKGHNSVVRMLLETGRAQMLYNSEGEHPLYHAIYKGDTDILEIFIRLDYDIEVPMKLSESGAIITIVQLAMEKSQQSVLHLLHRVGFPITVLELIPSTFDDTCGTNNSNALMQLTGDTTVPVLKSLCRRHIRRCLGPNIAQKIPELGLPEFLKNYVMLCDIFPDM